MVKVPVLGASSPWQIGNRPKFLMHLIRSWGSANFVIKFQSYVRMCIVSWDGHDKFWQRQQADLHQNLAQ